MKISKKVREEAALICQIAASNNMSISESARSLGVADGPAGPLALGAFFDFAVLVRSPYCATYADAEAILRTGWSP